MELALQQRASQNVQACFRILDQFGRCILQFASADMLGAETGFSDVCKPLQNAVKKHNLRYASPSCDRLQGWVSFADRYVGIYREGSWESNVTKRARGDPGSQMRVCGQCSGLALKHLDFMVLRELDWTSEHWCRRTSMMQPNFYAVGRLALRQRAFVGQRRGRITYSTEPQRSSETVQTPVQSQDKSDVAATQLRPEAESSRVQTPIQAQSSSSTTPDGLHQKRPRSSNAGPLYTFFGLLFLTPIISYYYYLYRQEHMDQKRAKLIADAEEKYKSRG